MRFHAQGGEFVLEVCVDLHHFLCRFDVARARVGEPQRRGAALEQLEPRFLLDQLDRLRKRGLRDIQLFRGRSNAALADDGHDVLRVLEVHK